MEKARILYVDDEHQNLRSFKAWFRRFYQVFTAQSGAEALELLSREKVELIITDQRMPQMTGVELLEKVLVQFPKPIRMVLTGYSDLHAIIQAINKGKIYYYITKPWDHEELKIVLDKGIEAYRLQEENQSLTEENQDLQLKSEQQEKENILSRFETLKNQVNPHFLFNSLNVLSSLVHEDPNLAEDFIGKLTKVYRYVLDLKDQVLVPLEEELAFIKSYFFLHQIRFGNKLRLYVQIPQEDRNMLLPPLTLQLLVENAIKHNIITHDHPLTIEMYTENGTNFVVKNNFQPRKQEMVVSTGIGLQNLKARYQFLSESQPSFSQDQNYYIAKVPLLSQSVSIEG
ncbi:MAG: histidine kinase [Bacteroidota bacterium]